MIEGISLWKTFVTLVSLINRWCPGLSRRCQVEFSITCRATKFSPRAAIVPYPIHVERFNVSPWAECGDRILSDLVRPYPFLATVLCKLIVAQETSKSWKLDVAVPLQSDGTISSRTSFWDQWQSNVIYSRLGAWNCPSLKHFEADWLCFCRKTASFHLLNQLEN